MKSKDGFKTDAHLEKYMGLLVSWANKYTKFGLGQFDDMLQDTMMIYLKVCDSFDVNNGSKFGTYLYSSLQNEMRTKIKQLYNEPFNTVSLDVNLNDSDSFLDLIEDDSINIDPSYEIITMRYQGMTMDEIALELGVSRRTAYRMLEEERKNFI